MDKKTADQLAADLLQLMRSGNDARTRIDYICNHLRIKKKAAASLQTIFELGVHAGCDAVINGDDNSLKDNQTHPLYCAAYCLGRDDFKHKYREMCLKQEPQKVFVRYGLIISMALVLAVILAIVFMWIV